MNWNRISAMMYRYILILRNDLARVLDTFYWPLIDLLAWGYLTMFISQNQIELNSFAATLLAGIIMWTAVYSVARDVAVSFLDDMWDRNIVNIFCSPLKIGEFLIASFLIALGRVAVSTIVLCILALIIYSFNMLTIGLGLAIFYLILVIFAF